VKVDDSIWRAVGPDIEAGARVRVTGVRDAVLVVEPAEVRFGAAPRAGGPAAAGDPRP
jgi:membrane-bound ClpP family serine protease